MWVCVYNVDIRCRWFPVASVWQATSSCLSSCTSPPQFHQSLPWKTVTHSFLQAEEQGIIQRNPNQKSQIEFFSGTSGCGQKMNHNQISTDRYDISSQFVLFEQTCLLLADRGRAPSASDSFTLRNENVSGSSNHVIFSNSMQMRLTSTLVYSNIAADICMET